MTIKTLSESYRGDATPKECEITQFISDALTRDTFSTGELETMRKVQNEIADGIGRLVNKLAEKGILTKQDVLDVGSVYGERLVQ